jgi:hypothetical protein
MPERGKLYRLRVAYHRRLFAIGEWWWLLRHGPLPVLCASCGAVYEGECVCNCGPHCLHNDPLGRKR